MPIRTATNSCCEISFLYTAHTWGSSAFIDVAHVMLVVNRIQKQLIRTWINELEVSSCALGDFNEDGTTNILDIVQIVNFILGSGAGDEFCGDANEDGTLNILDVVLIVNIILGD